MKNVKIKIKIFIDQSSEQMEQKLNDFLSIEGVEYIKLDSFERNFMLVYTLSYKYDNKEHGPMPE